MALEQLPIEILHDIGDFLAVEDIATLRRVSRNMSAKVSQGPFGSILRSKTRLVEFSPRSLQLLVEMTRPGAPGTALESLVLVGVPLRVKGVSTFYNTDIAGERGLVHIAEENDDDRASITALLAEAMRNLNANGEHRGLPSLSLTVDPRTVGNLTTEWVAIWTAASWMFQITLDALRRSGGLNLTALDLFTRPYCCSLSRANFWREDLDELLRQCSPSIGNVRRLQISISRERAVRSRTESGGTELVWPPMVPEEPWAPRKEGFARFLAAFSSVEDVKIHLYRISSDINGLPSLEPDWFRQVSARRALENLTRCTLQGFSADGDDLLGFFRASPGLREVDMDSIDIIKGSSTKFRQVFDWLTTRAGSRLRYLRLEDLSEESIRVVFQHEPDDEVDNTDGWGLYRLTRRGEASVRRPVRYARTRGDMPMPMWAFHMAVARDKLKYGFPLDREVKGTNKTVKDYY